MENLREQLVEAALSWESAFGNTPLITTVLSEYDAASLVGCPLAEYASSAQGITAARKGHDFVFHGARYQAMGNRSGARPGSFVIWVPRASNYKWDYLVWIMYNSQYDIHEAWQWEVADYVDAFDSVRRLSPADLRRGKRLA